MGWSLSLSPARTETAKQTNARGKDKPSGTAGSSLLGLAGHSVQSKLSVGALAGVATFAVVTAERFYTSKPMNATAELRLRLDRLVPGSAIRKQSSWPLATQAKQTSEPPGTG
jgi:hypothetical protein